MRLKMLFGPNGPLNAERRTQLLLISIVLFFVLRALSESHEVGRLYLLLNLYVTLVAAVMELAEKRIVFWTAIPICTPA